jgi:hypothetical protein
MALLTQYDTPAFLPDFNSIPGQLEAWNRAVSAWFDQNIAADQAMYGHTPLQYYNAATFDPGGIAVEQEITWNAFPKELLRRYGRERALTLADRPWPIESFGVYPPDPDNTAGTSGIFYRPQEEYCEWHVRRDPDTDRILQVTFTSEPPEYWMSLTGVVPGDPTVPIGDQYFPGDPTTLLRLYHELVSPDVKYEDLFVSSDLKDANGKAITKKEQYNIYNKWNSTLGIAHLNSPPNSLVAEIKLGADASILYTDPKSRLLVEPDALMAYADYGGANRNSDPTIGATVNALARLGAYVTLRNPVGLYMDHIDLSGWEAPDKKSVSECIRILRGLPGMIERMVVEIPEKRGFTVSDLTIAGVPIRYGGQIAECITVKLVGIANIVPKHLPRLPAAGTGRVFIDPRWPLALERFKTTPPGAVEGFLNEGIGDPKQSSVATTPVRKAGIATYSAQRRLSRFRF